MAHFYNYYYVGDLNLTEDELHRSPPLLLTFSKVQNGPKGEVPPHMHAHLEIFYFESGTGFFDLNGQTHSIKADDLLVVDSKHMHMQYSENSKTPLTYYCFAVDNLHLRGLKNNCLSTNGFFIHSFGCKKNDVYYGILKLLGELKDHRYSYASKVEAIFITLLIDIIRLNPITDDTQDVSETTLDNRILLNAVKEYIEEHYADDISLADLTKVSLMDKSYFLHQFKKRYNISPMRYLTLVRIEQAKLLLTNNDSPISIIAGEVGIDNPVYFTEVFTKAVGVSPTAYRKIVISNSENKGK